MEAKAKLDLFTEFADTPNFINYDMLENKDQSRPDLIVMGEKVVDGLEEHKDVVFSKVADQVHQLGLKFDERIITSLNKAVECQIVDGVKINMEELGHMADMIREASQEEQSSKSRQSINTIMNSVDGDDLLADDQFFERSKATAPS